jgi:hypothetical protein
MEKGSPTRAAILRAAAEREDVDMEPRNSFRSCRKTTEGQLVVDVR